MRTGGGVPRSGGAVLSVVLAVTVLAGGCSGGSSEPQAQTVTHTVTETATVTVTATATVAPPAADGGLADEATATVELPVFELTVLEDGCAVERTEGDADNLGWSVKDDLGVQVLGRNALGETRYRYFVPGTYTVVLEAWAGDRYAPVSNEVTITC